MPADLGGTEPVLPVVGAALRFLACAVGARTAVEIGNPGSRKFGDLAAAAACARARRLPA